jgi:hypothetical protein
MDGLSIPERQDDPAGKASRRSGGGKRRAEEPQRRRLRIASAEECLAVLSQLGSLVALGILSTAQANSIRSTNTAILQYHIRQQSGPSRTITNEKGLAEMLKKHPEFANMLEPLLTNEQIQMLARGGKDAEDVDESA